MKFDSNNFYNTLCFCKEENLEIALNNCSKINYAAISAPKLQDSKINYYKLVTNNEIITDQNYNNLFLPTLLLNDDTLDSVVEHVFINNTNLIVNASYCLLEAGKIDARFNLTPIQLLHKLGILKNCTIAGGAALLNEDLDLLMQENIPLIFMPTYSAGNGYGFCPLKSAQKRQLNITIGTGDNVYNPNSSLDKELEFLYLSTCANLNKKNAVSFQELNNLSKYKPIN